MLRETYDTLRAIEGIVRDRFGDEAGAEASLADIAAALLLMVLSTVDERSQAVAGHGTQADGSKSVQLQAQHFIGVRIFRTIRAARAVLAAGYEPEARAHNRVLLELLAHRDAVRNDPSGVQAAAWLSGKRGQGVSASVKAMTQEGLYSRLSHYSHGGPEPVLHLLDLEQEALFIAPSHSIATRASLLLHARVSHDQAVMISELDGTPLDSPDGFDQQMHDVRTRLAADATRLECRTQGESSGASSPGVAAGWRPV